MKLVWVSHSSNDRGGAERFLWEASAALVERGLEVHALLPSEGPLRERLEREGVAVTVISYPLWVHSGTVWRPPFYHRLKRALAHRRAADALTRFMNEAKPDVVMTNTLTVPDGARAAKRAGLPHVWYLQEFGREDHHLIFDAGDRYSLSFIDRHSDRIIVNSRAVYEKFARSLPEEKLRLVYAGVVTPPPPEPPERPGDAPFWLLIMGQMVPGKRQEDAIRAVSHLKRRGLNVRLSLVGSQHDADYAAFLARSTQELGLEPDVEFIGHTDDPYSCYAQADLALICSRSEAFGRVTVEAMQMGKPVVGARSGSTPELICEGETGCLYEPGNAEDLADKIEALYRNRDLLKEMGVRAREWACETFSMERYTEGLRNVLEEAILAARPQATR